MKEIRIFVRCTAEPAKHAKVIRVKARLGRQKALELADLLDGTSLAYVHPPGANSPIGRCCICQAEVLCAVSEIVDGKEVPTTCEQATEEKVQADAKQERKLATALKKSATSVTKKEPKRIARSAERHAASTV